MSAPTESTPNGENHDSDGWIAPVGRAARPHPDERDDGEHRQRGDLGAEQPALGARVDLDADDADQRHQPDPHDAQRGHEERRRVVDAEQQERVLAGDLREIGHDDDVGDDDRPAAHPAGEGTEGPRRPRERGAGIGVRLVEVLVGERDEQHRDERDDEHAGRVHADAADRDDHAEDGGEAVARGGRRHPDDDARRVSDGIALEPLGRGLGSHTHLAHSPWKLDRRATFTAANAGRIWEISQVRVRELVIY